MLPPMMKRSLSLWGRRGSSLRASARLVSGPRATKDTYWEKQFRNTTWSPHKNSGTYYLLLIFRCQSDHCIYCMLRLNFFLPLRVFVHYHIPKSITSKVVTEWVTDSHEGAGTPLKHWNLQDNSGNCSSFIARRGNLKPLATVQLHSKTSP